MNNILKLGTALVATGTTAGVVWAVLPSSKPSEYEILKAKLEKIAENRVDRLKEVFVSVAETEREKMAKVITGSDSKAIIFKVNEDIKDFYDRDYVANEVGVWCKRDNDSEIFEKLNKEEICKL